MKRFEGLIRQLQLKLDRCSDPNSANALRYRRRIEWVVLRMGMQRCDVTTALLRYKAAQHLVEYLELRAKELSSNVGQWGQTLGLGVTTPCLLIEELQERRRAWRAALGRRPKGGHICHRCDVRKCAAEDHLFWGTATDNMRDMQLKGRGRGGDAMASVRRRMEAALIRLAAAQEHLIRALSQNR